MFFIRMSLSIALALTSFASLAESSKGGDSRIVAGTDYQILEMERKPTGPRNGKVEVIEFFYFGCQACMRMDPVLRAWEKRNSAHVKVRRIPVAFSRRLEGHAFLYGALERLKIEGVAAPAVFEEVMVNRNYLLTSTSQAQFVKRFGVSETDFQKALHAPETAKAVAEYAQLAKAYKVDAVPAVIFNGNQLVTVGTTPQRTSEILDALLKKSRRVTR